MHFIKNWSGPLYEERNSLITNLHKVIGQIVCKNLRILIWNTRMHIVLTNQRDAFSRWRFLYTKCNWMVKKIFFSDRLFHFTWLGLLFHLHYLRILFSLPWLWYTKTYNIHQKRWCSRGQFYHLYKFNGLLVDLFKAVNERSSVWYSDSVADKDKDKKKMII